MIFVFNRSTLVIANENLKMAQARLAAAARRLDACTERKAFLEAQENWRRFQCPQAASWDDNIWQAYKTESSRLQAIMDAAERAYGASVAAVKHQEAYHAERAAVAALSAARAAQQVAVQRQKAEAGRKAKVQAWLRGESIFFMEARDWCEAARKGWLDGGMKIVADPGRGYWDSNFDFRTHGSVPAGGRIHSPKGHIYRIRTDSTGHCPSGPCGKQTTIHLVGWEQPKARRGIARSTELGVRPRLPGGWAQAQAAAA